MNKFNNDWIVKYWFFIFIMIIIVLIGISNVSPYDIIKSATQITLLQLFILLSIYIAISIFTILSRKFLLYSLSSFASLRHLFSIHFVTMAAHYSTPAKIGFPLTVYLLKKLDNVPYPAGTTMILIELVVSTGLCGIIAFIGSFFYFPFIREELLHIYWILGIAAILTFTLLAFSTRNLANKRLFKFFIEVKHSLSTISSSHLILFLFVRLFIELFSSLNLVLLCSFFSSEISILQSVVVNSTAFFLGAISMVPLGLGIREGSILIYFNHLGISPEIGLVVVTIQRLISTGLTFILGSVLGVFLGFKGKEWTLKQ